MNFDFSEDQKLLQKAARDFLEDRSPLQVNRDVLESDSDMNADLWKGAAEMGWLGAVVPEAYGGAGFSHLELVLIAMEVGRAIAPIPFSSSVYLATEALLQYGSDAQRKKYLPGLADGSRIGTFALVEGPGQPAPAGLKTQLSGDRLTGTKVGVPDGHTADFAVVVARSGDGVSLALVELGGPGVEKQRVDSIDPTRANAELRFSSAPAERLGAEGQGWELAERLLDRAAVLLAFEQLGGAERAFEITREFAMGRYAFGRPIASFQALKHRMAEEYVAVELAKSNCYYGAWALDDEPDELPIAACNARVSATQAFALCTREMIQIHGGVGYTWEYDCHLFYRRATQTGAVLGSESYWREKLIRRLIAKQAA